LITWIGLWCFIGASSPIFYWAIIELVFSMIGQKNITTKTKRRGNVATFPSKTPPKKI
jgi:hypothetical protein